MSLALSGLGPITSAGCRSAIRFACYISTMVRLVLGLLKGAVVGGALGFAALKLGVGGGAAAFVTYALIGGLVGMLCGKPPWRQDTFWTSALKGIGGLIVGALLYWGGSKLLGGVHLSLPASLGAPPDRPMVEIPILLGPAGRRAVGRLHRGRRRRRRGAAADKSKAKPGA